MLEETHTFLKQITGGFAGCDTGPTCVGANNDKSGPDGLNIITGTPFIYVGDVNSVKIIDTTSDTVVKTINIGGTSGLRADEGCYDPDHNLYMINSPGESPPFATYIDTTTQKIIATLLFTDPGSGAGGPASAGLEGCVYDHGTQSFLNNNDGSTANPNGEIDVIPASFILQNGNLNNPPKLTLPTITTGSGFKVFPLGNCDPTGMDLGPGTDVIVICRQGTTGALLTVEILNRVTGTVLATLNAGGGDQVTYDAATNRYYIGGSRWTASGFAGVNGACSAATPCTPSRECAQNAAWEQHHQNDEHAQALLPSRRKKRDERNERGPFVGTAESNSGRGSVVGPIDARLRHRLAQTAARIGGLPQAARSHDRRIESIHID